ncbi:hypothetical protein C8Q70DRAFT_609599 [Cubamyces menziesii]|nr:hypothetical protein C8Q70DRAFT_609599 [Cubamyces menziesii]
MDNIPTANQQLAYLHGQLSVVSNHGYNPADASSPLRSLGSGSGSSSNIKLPPLSSGQDTIPLAESDTPKVLEPSSVSLELAPAPPVPVLSAETGPTGALHDPVSPSTFSISPFGLSTVLIGPTRASIQAWAKVTHAGAPRDTPSPRTSVLHSSGSDDNSSCVSLTRSAARSVDLPHGHRHRSGHAELRQCYSSQRPSTLHSPSETEGSQGSIADGENSGSELALRVPHLSPPSSPRQRLANHGLLAPLPHPRARTAHPRPQPDHLHRPSLQFHQQARLQARPHVSANSSPHSNSSASPLPDRGPEYTPSRLHEFEEWRDRDLHRPRLNSRRQRRDRDGDQERDGNGRRPRALPPIPTTTHTLPPLRPLPPPASATHTHRHTPRAGRGCGRDRRDHQDAHAVEHVAHAAKYNARLPPQRC